MQELGYGRGPSATRRRLLAAGAGTAAALGVAACGGGGRAANAVPGGAPVELRLHGAATGAEGDYWPKVASGFNARQRRAHVTFEPWAPEKGVFVLGASGTLGDVMRLVTNGDYAQVAVKSLLLDQNGLVAKDKHDLKQYYPAAVETLRRAGKLFGLPHIAHPGFCGQYVNLDTLKVAGIKEPDEYAWTLADYQSMVKQLSTGARDGTQWGMFPATAIQHVTVATRAFGGNTLSADGKKSLVADPASVQGIQLLADLHLKDRAAPAPGVLQGSNVQNFAGGQVATVWQNFGIINELRKQAQGLQWRVFMHPKGPQGKGFFLGVDAAAIGATTKQPDAAFELAKYICSKEVCLGWFDVGFAPGARPDTWNDPKITADAAYKMYARAMPEAAPLILPDNGLTSDYNSAVTGQLNAIWSGKSSVRDAVEAARRAGQEVLDRAGG